MSHISPTEDERICAWFECQTEETLRDLHERFDAVSPRECWTAFFNDCSSPAPESLGVSLAVPVEAVQEVPSPSEKLAVLREEFRLKAQASSALLVRAPALRFKRKVDREDLPYQRAQNFSAGINARITVQVPVDYPLLNGDRVVGVIEIRVHSLDRLKGDDRLYTIKALELAAQRIRDDIEACA
jgi:hypothetical protein